MKSIIIAIIMFLFLILVHEFGHFIIAKKSGIKVNEFAIGMGPKIFSKQKGETTYSLNLLPIGGYCAMEGEEEDSDDPRSFNNAKASKRFWTILAGPMMNFILAGIIFAIIIASMGTSSNRIGGFSEDSPAKAAGFKVGDEIVNIAGVEVEKFEDVGHNLREFYKDHDKKDPVEVTVIRDGQKIKKEFQVSFQEGFPMLGVTSQLQKVGFFTALGKGFEEVLKNIVAMFAVFGGLFSGQIGVGALSGPVGVVKELGNQASLGILNLLYFFAYISVNLGFFNLLPIPALDGSKIFTSLYEIISGKRVNRKLEEKATIVGFIALMTLILAITIKDVVSIFS
jgi:regulator of sigma E protease